MLSTLLKPLPWSTLVKYRRVPRVRLSACEYAGALLLEPATCASEQHPALTGPPPATSAPGLTGLSPLATAPRVRLSCPICTGLLSPLPHLRLDRAHPCHVCTGISPPLRDWAHPCHIGTGLFPPCLVGAGNILSRTTSALGPGSLRHICTGARPTPLHILGSPLRHLRCGLAPDGHMCTKTPPAPAPLQQRRWDWANPSDWAHRCQLLPVVSGSAAASAPDMGLCMPSSAPELGGAHPWQLALGSLSIRLHLHRDRAQTPFHVHLRT